MFFAARTRGGSRHGRKGRLEENGVVLEESNAEQASAWAWKTGRKVSTRWKKWTRPMRRKKVTDEQLVR